MRVTQRRDADTRQQIEIALALGVEEIHALAAHERDRVAPIVLQHVTRLDVADVRQRHELS